MCAYSGLWDAQRGPGGGDERRRVWVCPQLLVFRIKLAETAVASDYARENFAKPLPPSIRRLPPFWLAPSARRKPPSCGVGVGFPFADTFLPFPRENVNATLLQKAIRRLERVYRGYPYIHRCTL